MKIISIMYHDVVEGERWGESGFGGADAALYKLEREEFARHLSALAALGEGPAVVNELNGAARARISWALTFDDGGVSAHTVVANMLEERGWRGHFFVTTDFVGTPGFLSVAQMRDLRRRGHVVGSHSCSHPLRMARCGKDELLREWAGSLGFLSDALGEAVTTASVPGGLYSRRVGEAAARAGVRALFTSEPTADTWEVEGCLVLGRYAIQRRTPPETAAAIAAGRLAPRLRQKAVWEAKKVTKRLGGEYYLKARRALIGGR